MARHVFVERFGVHPGSYIVISGIHFGFRHLAIIADCSTTIVLIAGHFAAIVEINIPGCIPRGVNNRRTAIVERRKSQNAPGKGRIMGRRHHSDGTRAGSECLFHGRGKIGLAELRPHGRPGQTQHRAGSLKQTLHS